MMLDFLRQADCTFTGPALPEPFVRFELERVLRKHDLLPATDGLAGQTLRDQWDVFRRKLRDVSPNSGPLAIANRILEPLAERLGYRPKLAQSDDITTREGEEPGGLLMAADGGAALRCWTTDYDADLDAPTKRGYAYRFSPVRVAQRVLLTKGERVGLVTNGVELRLLLCDPARPDSQIEIKLNEWRKSRDMPDGYLLFLALAGPTGIAAIPDIVEQARLQQSRVTKELRVQARLAVEEFVQCVLNHPENSAPLATFADKSALAKTLWHEGLVLVYRLLFVLKCESTSDTSRAFGFAGGDLWRKTYSPSTALARMVRRVLDQGAQSGRYLEDGLRVLFRVFADGLNHPGLNVRPLGGALFGAASTPLLSDLRLRWGELAVARLLDRLLWTTPRRGTAGRTRVHYGPLDVEDLGRVYEALLELEPGIASEPMCRLRRSKLEVVVPAAQGEKYRAAAPVPAAQQPAEGPPDNGNGDEEPEAAEENDEEETPARGKKTKVEWIEAIPAGRFYLRVGLGRKSSGSYYTPHSFVRFLVQETLGPQCDQRSPRDNPNPGEILKLKVLDPACGSGHFLVEACRFLAGRLYEAARLCDELASHAEADAEQEANAKKKADLLARAGEFRKRNQDLPDPEDELLAYLPSRSAVAGLTIASSYSSSRAEAICRRLVAVHCLYGVDLNPLAAELAKLSLWIESHAEGLPLTFLDHRIVVGNSLTGPFWDKLRLAPGTQEGVQGLYAQDLDHQLITRLTEALSLVRELELSVGVDAADIADKEKLKSELDAKLTPFRILAAAWSGGVMLGLDAPDGEPRCDDEAYAALLKHVGATGELPGRIENPNLQAMIAKGLGLPADAPAPATLDELAATLAGGRCRPALPFDLAFPEVFFPTGLPHGRAGFDAVLGNPPWDRMLPADKEFFASYEFSILEASTKRERNAIQKRLLEEEGIRRRYEAYIDGFRADEALLDALYQYQIAIVNGEKTIGKQDAFRAFMERKAQLLSQSGRVGVVVPSAFHANEGATGVRRLYLEKMSLQCCFSFENKRKLFEIHSSFKFALVVAQNGKATDLFACAFYLHDDEWLFGDRSKPPVLSYTLDFVRRTGGDYLSLVELRSTRDAGVLKTIYSQADLLESVALGSGLRFGREVNLTDDEEHLAPIDPELLSDLDQWAVRIGRIHDGAVPLVRNRNFWQYCDHTGEPIDLCFRIRGIRSTAQGGASPLATSFRFYRIAWRKLASSTNERTAVFSLLPPGCVCDSNTYTNRSPDKSLNHCQLSLLAITNSYCFDFIARLMVAVAVDVFIVKRLPIVRSSGESRFLPHESLRLTCNHAGYVPLWREQLSNAWREEGKAPLTWPVLAGDDDRWAVRAAIDAVVADAYGLSREQYQHVLSTFSHASYPKAPALCLAAFDELKAIGLEAFCRKHDPYWDIPLNESLPKPVIDLPIPSAAEGELFREKSGQMTIVEPGPLYEGVKAVEPKSDPADPAGPLPRRQRRRRPARKNPADEAGAAAPAPDAGKLAAARTLLELRKSITCALVQEELKLDAPAARAILKHLVDDGHAVKTGKGLYRLR